MRTLNSYLVEEIFLLNGVRENQGNQGGLGPFQYVSGRERPGNIALEWGKGGAVHISPQHEATVCRQFGQTEWLPSGTS
jgi:hypothetical protein